MAGLNFLLIDDDPDEKEFFEIALKKVPFPIEFSYASDGMSGLRLLSNPLYTPDFIFLDLNMPILSGKECLVRIRQLPGYLEIPIIVYSTSSYQADIEDSKKMGASHFFIKVYKLDILAETITKLVSGNTLPFVLNSYTL
ncbi:DNA-binding response OmpR family regulator [Algoriphagus sp. 4150]|uniref:response regulator n=1 Tax=Algoriphagus sp. 4150 TaxID=2817756 RepID=UPI0028560DA8|nr:response regulator [Algoriphagus sp. 4150]MDR7127876.1 DNA-binding response OmpR family regulator [Algoriphagus sp. 4150]